jgi:hypothetical protein
MLATHVEQCLASEALQQSPIPALRRLIVEESLSEVRISGSVSSYYLKQLAQETIMPLLHERRLENCVVVYKT